MRLQHLVIVTWNGEEPPFNCVGFDAPPAFDTLLFNYSGNNNKPAADQFQPTYLLSKKTENKGQVFLELYQYLQQHQLNHYEYIGIIDDDICFRIADINYMLTIAAVHQLDIFQPSVSQDSYFSHRKFVNAPGYVITYTDWIEIMAPFYRKSLFDACHPYFPETISGQGIDCYLMPCIQRLQNKTRTAIIHAAIIRHARPIRTHLRTYSNGRTGDQEIEHMRQVSIELVNKSNPQLFDHKFRRQILEQGPLFVRKMEKSCLKMNRLLHNYWLFLKNLANR